MLNFAFSLLIATILGFLAGMGVGGGSLLLLWLTQISDMAQPQARILNLLFYIPAAFVASVFRLKKNALPLRMILPGLIAGCISAAVLTLISANWDTERLKHLLGWLLIAIGIKEIFYRPRNAR